MTKHLRDLIDDRLADKVIIFDKETMMKSLDKILNPEHKDSEKHYYQYKIERCDGGIEIYIDGNLCDDLTGEVSMTWNAKTTLMFTTKKSDWKFDELDEKEIGILAYKLLNLSLRDFEIEYDHTSYAEEPIDCCLYDDLHLEGCKIRRV